MGGERSLLRPGRSPPPPNRLWRCGGRPCPPGGCEHEHDVEIQRAPGTSQHGDPVPRRVTEVLRSPGTPLATDVGAEMEGRFGHDFSRVRVHTDARSAQTAREVHALAYTVGRDIVFAPGQYRPRSQPGRQLLAHELTHVIQQADSSWRPGDTLRVSAPTDPAEREAERAATRDASGGTGQPGHELDGASRPTADADHLRRRTGVHVARQEDPTPQGSEGEPRLQHLQLDVLGADLSVTSAQARAAAATVGADLRVISLEDMIGQLHQRAGPQSGKCIERVTIWHHGSPRGQPVVGPDEIRTRDGRTYRLPRSAMSYDWLLTSGNQDALSRLRGTFCCGATMRWHGCGTAGVQAAGGVRTEAEQSAERLRYGRHGDWYLNPEDAARHGASLLAATFGGQNAQLWSDATCSTVEAASDFTYISPSGSARVGHGGAFLPFHPRPGLCECDPATGRPVGAWTIAEAKQFRFEQTRRTAGPAHLWSLFLRTFRRLWPMRRRLHGQVVTAFRRLIHHAAERVAVPPGVPVADVRPWLNIDTENPGWAGVTTPYLAFCYPDNCWRWITVNQEAIETTPGYTEHVLRHELLHAQDVWSAAQEFQRTRGAPPGAPGARCRPVSEATSRGWTDPWGRYVNEFANFYEGRTGGLRHEEITAEAVTPHFSRMTADERLRWFAAVLRTIPPNLPSSVTFDAEQIVLQLFRNPAPGETALREHMAQSLARATQEFVLGDSARRVDLERGRSLLDHFGLVWRLRTSQRQILLDAVTRSGP